MRTALFIFALTPLLLLVAAGFILAVVVWWNIHPLLGLGIAWVELGVMILAALGLRGVP